MLIKKLFDIDEAIISNNFDIKQYTHIRGYHGCSPMNIKDYYENGIVPINKKLALEQAIKLLSSDMTSKDEVERVFDSSWNELEDVHKHVWMVLSKEELLNKSGHYLIYGSEFIYVMAAKLFCEGLLRGKGKPTIFYCDVPIDIIPNDYIEDMNEQIRQGNGGICGFKIIGSLLSQNIVKCEHPSRILDPLNGYEEYYPKLL